MAFSRRFQISSSSNKSRTIEDWIAVLAMAGLCVITMANVVVRYLSDESFAWTEELSVFLLILTTMSGAAAAAAFPSAAAPWFPALLTIGPCTACLSAAPGVTPGIPACSLALIRSWLCHQSIG